MSPGYIILAVAAALLFAASARAAWLERRGPSLPDTPMLKLAPWDDYSRKVKP